MRWRWASVRDQAQQLLSDVLFLRCNDDIFEIPPLLLIEQKRTEIHRSELQKSRRVRLILQLKTVQLHCNQAFPEPNLEAMNLNGRRRDRISEFWYSADS